MAAFQKGDRVQYMGSPAWANRAIRGTVTDVYREDGKTWFAIKWDAAFGCTRESAAVLRIVEDPRAPARAFEYWTIEEDDKLLRAVRTRVPISMIRENHGRTFEALRCRLSLLAGRDVGAPGEFATLEAALRWTQAQKSGYTNRAVRAKWGMALKEQRLADAAKAAAEPLYEKARKLIGHLCGEDRRGEAVKILEQFNVSNLRSVPVGRVGEVVSLLERAVRPDGVTWPSWHVFKTGRCSGLFAEFWRTVGQEMFPSYGNPQLAIYSAAPNASPKSQEVPPVMDTKFYALYSAGGSPLSGTYATKAQAVTEAEAQVRRRPADTYYVMEAVESVSLVQPKVAVKALKAAPKRKAAKARRTK
jgi:hypothetical protein